MYVQIARVQICPSLLAGAIVLIITIQSTFDSYTGSLWLILTVMERPFRCQRGVFTGEKLTSVRSQPGRGLIKRDEESKRTADTKNYGVKTSEGRYRAAHVGGSVRCGGSSVKHWM